MAILHQAVRDGTADETSCSGTQRSSAVTSNASPGVSFGSGTIGVGCWPRPSWVTSHKNAKARINIGEHLGLADAEWHTSRLRLIWLIRLGIHGDGFGSSASSWPHPMVRGAFGKCLKYILVISLESRLAMIVAIVLARRTWNCFCHSEGSR